MSGAATSSASDVTPEEVRAYFAARRMTIVTFLGYSGAGYEDEAAMLDQAARTLGGFDPGATIVNIGATADGIGAVYRLAKQMGFVTSGIVSSKARECEVPLSSCVDIVLFVKDATWGGFLPGTQTLSPTSRAIVEVSHVLVAIGGGEVARDEFVVAKRLGKRVEFFPADMNHQIACARARELGQPDPTDYRGAAANAP